MKPFSYNLLIKRIEAVLRRSKEDKAGVYLTFEKIKLNLKTYSAEIDGKIIDSKNYSSKEGSTIITLKSDYLNTLSVGKHTISINSTTGSASTEFIIESNVVETPVKAENKEEVKKVKTGDDENIIGVVLLLVGSLVVLTYIRKKKIE